MTTNLRSRLACGATCVLAAFALFGCGGGDGDSSTTPPASTTLTLSGSSAGSVSLAWTQDQAATGYTLERRSSSGDFQSVAELPPQVHQYLDEGLEAHTAYTYRLLTHRGSSSDSTDGGASTTDDVPEVSAVGAALAETGRAVIGAAGGSAASTDGGARVDVPAGAWASEAPVVLQSQENTAPGGVGTALRLILPAAPAQAITITLAYDEAAAPDADGLGVALQRRDGSWLSLPVGTLDHEARRIIFELPAGAVSRSGAMQIERAHASEAEVSIELTLATFQRLYLSPKHASLHVGDTQRLVPYERTVTSEQGEEQCFEDSLVCLVPIPVVKAHQAPFLNSKGGYTRQWLVQGSVGGTSALGLVQAQGDVGAIYTAPRRAPTPNPVKVGFRSTHDKSGRSIELSADVAVAEPMWTGIVHGTLDGAADLGFSFSMEAVWTLATASDDEFHASGTQSIHVIDITCTGSASPSTVPLPPGLLKIDRSVTPAHYTLDVGSLWNTVISGSCPGLGSTSVGMVVPGRLEAEGSVSADGTRIEDTAHFNNVQWDWSLTSQLQP